jgi:hypothetical protein
MSDYNTGKIYKLFVKGAEELCYIGSTVSTLVQRLYMHRYHAITPTQNKSASSQMFEDGNEVEIELLEDYPCDSKKELETRERYWLEQFPEAININTPTRTWKERWVANREHNIAKHKDWLKANADHVAEYREGRKEIEKAGQKARYDAGYKAKRNEAKKVKVACAVCGKEMNKNSLWEHNKKVHPPDTPP